MRNGMSPQRAAESALQRILKRYASFSGALIGVSRTGEVGELLSLTLVIL